jgi:LmbE family N-acetylglucosaminyl deacetylase
MTPDTVARLGTILGVWAHPDDEAFLSAGLMAMAVDAGSRVVCVTATRGEAGTSDPERVTPEAVARTREAELAECLAILGVTEHRWLDYLDGRCSDADADQAVGKVRAIIDEVQPDTILTFGPEGFTDHADHKAVSRWVVAAHSLAPNATERRLHFATQTAAWARDYLAPLAAVDAFPPGLPPLTPTEELSIDASLPQAIIERKVRALRAQRSQIEGLVAAVGASFFADAFSSERFRPGTRAAVTSRSSAGRFAPRPARRR